MSKSRINYLIDVLILAAFLLVSLSGIVLLLIPGGRGLSQYAALGISRAGWVELHDWAGIATVAGVFLHFVLHWRWVTCMTNNMLRGPSPRQREKPCPVTIESR